MTNETAVKKTTTPIMEFLSCDSSVFLSRDLQSALRLPVSAGAAVVCFTTKRTVPPPSLAATLPTRPRSSGGKGHTAGGQARSCRCATLLVSAGLLGPGGFPAGLSAPSRDWVGPARPQRQHGPGAQLTSGRREEREGDERHRRRTGWLSLLNGMNGQYFRCGCCLTRRVAHQLHNSKPVVLCY